jgi:flavin reductase (DIM6/NTAB) family NADH-FMN oxidoreductase RutF
MSTEREFDAALYEHDVPPPQHFDAQTFRRALGRFATGVAVVTTRNTDGRPVGLTINSFSSVSLDPPLIAWSLRRESTRSSVFERCSHYAVHILSAGQQALSVRFATQPDPFDGLWWADGLAGCPLLDGCCAQFIVRNTHRYPGGDHFLYMGEVVALACSQHEPLLFFGGRYRRLEAAK